MNHLAEQSAASAEAPGGVPRGRVSGASAPRGYGRSARVAMAAVAVLGGLAACGTQAGHASSAPSTVATSSASAVPAADGPAVSPNAVPGTLVYLRVAGGRLQVVTVRDGATTTKDFGTTSDAEQVRSVSPDGTRIAVIHSPNWDYDAPGDLVIVSEGGARHTVASNVAWGGGQWATWTPDGTQVMVTKSNAWQLVKAADGTVTPLPAVHGDYFTWSTNGAYRAYRGSDGIVVSRPDWTVVSRTSVAGFPGCPQSIGCGSVQAVSDDGRYVAVGHNNTDPQHVVQPLFILDTTTGRAVTMPTGMVSTIMRVFFRSGGGMVVQGSARTITVIGPDGTVAANVPDPDPNSEDSLVGYRA